MSCGREDVVRQKFAGVWTISEMESIFYTNGQEDSVVRYDGLGKLGLFDNASYGSNILIYDFNAIPAGMPRNFTTMMANSPDWYWHTDGTSEDELSLYSEKSSVGIRMYFIYTVEKRKAKTLELVFTSPDPNDISLPAYRERITLTRE